jgi:hypothetical protein
MSARPFSELVVFLLSLPLFMFDPLIPVNILPIRIQVIKLECPSDMQAFFNHHYV